MAFDGAIGSEISEVVDGVYTGRPTGVFVYRSGKAEAIEELAREGSTSPPPTPTRTRSPTCRCCGGRPSRGVNPDGAGRIARERAGICA